MVIDLDVHEYAKQWGLDERLIQAVRNSEGSLLKAVQKSIPSITTEQQALDVVCRSAVHAMNDYIRATDPRGFVQMWGQRWAPVGAGNDPSNLNANWPKNVLALWLGSHLPPVSNA